MEYERIQKPHLQQQKQLSPAKLRAMILGGGGTEKKRRQGGGEGEEAEELSTGISVRSHDADADAEIHDSGFYKSGATSSEECKDVDVVSVQKDCSTSAKMDSHDCKTKDFLVLNSGGRPLDDSTLDYDIGIESTSLSAFEFQKGERFPQRVPLTPFSKPAPSKWDDAQKWIASPTSNRSKTGSGGNQWTGMRKTTLFGHGSRQQSTKVINEIPDEGLFPDEEPDTKWIDSSHAKKDNVLQKSVSFDAYQSAAESHDQQIHVIDQCAVESAINLSRHDSLLSIHGSTTIIPPLSMARSVSMRDMGTEMTPIASQEPSRAGTPVRATTPTRSPASSRPETPGRAASGMPINSLDINNNDLSEKELHMKTRREIMALGTQLGKANIAAWASKDDENKEGSSTIRTLADDKQPNSAIQTRAAAWEEAENAKYIARFKREEIKIQAWENHQRAKTEAEMRKIEVDVEKMRSKAHDKLMNKLATVQQKAEEKRAKAEAQRNRRAAKTEQQAEHIRKTGRIPSAAASFFCCRFRWCFWN